MADAVGKNAIDPFQDPSMAGSTPTTAHGDVPATLNMGRNASLTLGTDTLIVFGTCSQLGESSRLALTGCR